MSRPSFESYINYITLHDRLDPYFNKYSTFQSLPYRSDLPLANFRKIVSSCVETYADLRIYRELIKSKHVYILIKIQ